MCWNKPQGASALRRQRTLHLASLLLITLLPPRFLLKALISLLYILCKLPTPLPHGRPSGHSICLPSPLGPSEPASSVGLNPGAPLQAHGHYLGLSTSATFYLPVSGLSPSNLTSRHIFIKDRYDFASVLLKSSRLFLPLTFRVKSQLLDLH